MTVDPNSTAARLAAGVNTTEAEQDRRLRYGSPTQHLRDNVVDELRRRGVQEHAFRQGLDRVLGHAVSSGQGDAGAIADTIVEEHPAFFVPAPQPTASTLVERFRSGATVQRGI